MKKYRKKNEQIDWTHVTPFSKTIAFILFLTLPFIGFVLGMKYQEQLMSVTHIPYDQYLHKLKIDTNKMSAEGTAIAWETAQELVTTCRVTSIAENPDGVLALTLKDETVKLVQDYNREALYHFITVADGRCDNQIVIGNE